MGWLGGRRAALYYFDHDDTHDYHDHQDDHSDRECDVQPATLTVGSFFTAVLTVAI